jgi:NADH-quinone oxidoreductase subunit M
VIVVLLAVPLAGALLLLVPPERYRVRGAARAERAIGARRAERAERARRAERAETVEQADGAERAEGAKEEAKRGDGANTVERYARVVGVLFSGLALLVAAFVAAGFDYRQPQRMAHVIDLSWAPAIGLRFHVGVDGVSLPLVVLTALLTFLCLLYLLCTDRAAGGEAGPGGAGRPGRPGGRALVGLVLLLETGLLGVFVALDLVLFFMFFEALLVPMYFVIGIWGAGPGRSAAAYKFILSTVLGSAVLLVGLMIIATKGGTLDMVVLARQHGAGLSHGAQVAAFLLVGLGFAVTVPMWPLHSWLPDAHAEAPIAGSVLLAGVLLKVGTYGLIRIALPMAPAGARTWAPWLGLLAVAGIVYGPLACLAQRELRRLFAYSSVGFMGFALLGVATLTPAGANAALFGNVAHGLIIGLLFFLTGSIEHRYGTGDLDAIGAKGPSGASRAVGVVGGGMLRRLPRLGVIVTFASLAGLGLPGLAGFWGEMLSLLGAYRPGPGLPRSTFVTFMAVGGLGVVLTMAYFLRLLARLTSGPVAVAAGTPGSTTGSTTGSTAGSATSSATGLEEPDRPGAAGMRDMQPYEYAVFVPLVALTLVIGLWPKVLLDLSDGPVRALLGGG